MKVRRQAARVRPLQEGIEAPVLERDLPDRAVPAGKALDVAEPEDAAVEGDERQEAAWSKLSGYAARLALVGQLARNPLAEIVTREVMPTACDLARWFVMRMIFTARPLVSGPKVKKKLARIPKSWKRWRRLGMPFLVPS